MSLLSQIIRAKRNKKISQFLLNSKARKNLLVGSAGSGKSWSVGQHLLLDKALNQPKVRILVTRTTGPALKKSCWLLMTDLLSTYDIEHKTNLSDLTITLFNGTQFFFVPLDDINKLKSIERINYVWAEEATQLSKQEYTQLDLRTRGDNPYGINQLYFTFNPDDENSFLKELCENPPGDVAVHHSTYKDNAFNTREYIETIEQLKNMDYTYWMIYGLGIWATPTGIIYSNWDIIKDSDWPEQFDEVIYGLDFGFTNPSALIEIGIKETELFCRELIYASRLTTPQLIKEIDEFPQVQDGLIYADSAQPSTIEEIGSGGKYAIMPADKSQHSVIEGIVSVLSYRLHLHEDSINLHKEIRGYKWRTDKNGDVIDKEIPVKFNDHLMDALRMAMFTHTGTIIPSVLVW